MSWRVTVVNNERNQLREFIGVCNKGISYCKEKARAAAVMLFCSFFLLLWSLAGSNTLWLWVGAAGCATFTGMILYWVREAKTLAEARSSFCYELLKEDIDHKHRDAEWDHRRRGRQLR